MNLKCLLNLNIKSVPWFSKNSTVKNSTWKKMIDDNIDSGNLSDDDLVVVCLQEAYGYRTGILGWTCTFLSSCIPNCIQNFINRYTITSNNVYCTPLDILITSVVLLNRVLPLINYGIWDNKNRIFKHNKKNSVLKYINKNDSNTNIFDYRSLFCLNPIFDSGCCIMSNKKPLYSGFEKLDLYSSEILEDRLCNKGIVWCYYDEGILVMTYNLSENTNDLTKLIELDQILTLQEDLERILKDKYNIQNLKSYIVGDFRVQCYNNDNLSFRDLLKNYNVAYVSNFNHYIFYKNIDSKLNTQIINQDNPIFKINFDQDVSEYVVEIPEEIIKEVSQELQEFPEELQGSPITIKESIINPIYDYFKRLSPVNKELEDWNMI